MSDNWEIFISDDGKEYYYNKIKNITTWEKPEEILSNKDNQCIDDWEEYSDDNGDLYYHSAKKNETVWTKPEAFILKEKELILKKEKELSSKPIIATNMFLNSNLLPILPVPPPPLPPGIIFEYFSHDFRIFFFNYNLNINSTVQKSR